MVKFVELLGTGGTGGGLDAFLGMERGFDGFLPELLLERSGFNEGKGLGDGEI